jgi:CTD small phosphatase-like protein 2
MIIDNMPENFINQPNNGLSIKTWKDDINDKELTEIKKILTHIFDLKIKNVMNIIKNINSLISNQICTYSTLDFEKL